MKHKRTHLILLVISIFLVTGSFFMDRYAVFPPEEIALKATAAIKEKSMACKEELGSLFENDTVGLWEQLHTYYDKERVGLYLWENDSIIFWNNSQIPLNQDVSVYKKNQGMIKFPQGFYVYFKEKKGNQTALALCLVKPTTSYKIIILKMISDNGPLFQKGLKWISLLLRLIE